MLFSSLTFLFFFLPLSAVLYGCLPAVLAAVCHKRGDAFFLTACRNGVLLSLGVLFYAFGAPKTAWLLPLMAVLTFVGGRWLSCARHRRAVLALLLFLNLLPLLAFKYAVPFLALFAVYLPTPALPLGISFFTFQFVAYLVDIYRGSACGAPPLSFFTYVFSFPQMLSGPIVRYGQVEGALACRPLSLSGVSDGAERFLMGLAKKTVLAAGAGEMFLVAVSGEELSFLSAWLGVLGFAYQIYFDFSGYSDMAIGLGGMLGFSLPENFNYPYLALGFGDFWRRWHITLSQFFRDYVYIPLGGSRHGTWRTLLSMLAVWALTGLWHGAKLNFLLWGLYFFLGLALEKFVLGRWLKKLPSWCRRALCFLGVLFGWVLFAFDGSTPYLTLSRMKGFLWALLGGAGLTAGNHVFDVCRNLPFLLILSLFATPLPLLCRQKIKARAPRLCVLLSLGLLVLSVSYLCGGGFVPFLYFQF